MNEHIKELAEQSGLVWSESRGLWIAYDDSKDLERFAELIRLDETKACAKHYLEIMRDAVEQARADERDKCVRLFARLNCDAVDAARLEEREAIAALVEADGRVHEKAPDAVWAKTVAKLIRARSEK
jgi:hypothetical protein